MIVNAIDPSSIQNKLLQIWAEEIWMEHPRMVMSSVKWEREREKEE